MRLGLDKNVIPKSSESLSSLRIGMTSAVKSSMVVLLPPRLTSYGELSD